MISEETIQHYNSKLNVNLSELSKLTPSQRDRVMTYGTSAENLLKNKDFAMFVHHFKFDVADALGSIRGHSAEDNCQRVALSNELVGIDNFVNSLKRAVYHKERIGKMNIPDTIGENV